MSIQLTSVPCTTLTIACLIAAGVTATTIALLLMLATP